jgi:hypothetical protein
MTINEEVGEIFEKDKEKIYKRSFYGLYAKKVSSTIFYSTTTFRCAICNFIYD